MFQCEIMDLIKYFRNSSMEKDIYNRTIHGIGDSVQLACIISFLKHIFDVWYFSFKTESISYEDIIYIEF